MRAAIVTNDTVTLPHNFHVIAPDHIQGRRSWREVGQEFTNRVRSNTLFRGLPLATGVFWSNGWQSHVFVLRINTDRGLNEKQLLALNAYTIQYAYTVVDGVRIPRINKLKKLEWRSDEGGWLAYYTQDPRSGDVNREMGTAYTHPRWDAPYNIMNFLCWNGPPGSWG